MSGETDEPSRIELVEVLLRDGLQNEAVTVPTEVKLRWARDLVASGARRIEAVSFVHPRLVPAMADAEAVMEGVPRDGSVAWSGLVLNRRGLERARDAGVDEVNVVVCASETFGRRNQNVSTDEAVDVAQEVVAAARGSGLRSTVTIATAFGCPFEGEVSAHHVGEIAARVVVAGPDELCFADTIGVGVPGQVRALGQIAQEISPSAALRFHFHDTRNTAVANVAEAVRLGARVFDASVGGFGGCPFAPGASGNVATEDVDYLLKRSGVATGLDPGRTVALAREVGEALGKAPASALSRAGGFPGDQNLYTN